MSVDPRKLPALPELMIVGPGELRDDDLTALGQQVIPHFGEPWVTLHGQVLAWMRELLGCAEDPYVVPGSGTTCLDAGIMNLFEPGQQVVVPDTGFFGERLIQIATQQGLDVTTVPVEVGAPIDPARIADVIGGAHGVLTTHVDTSTGVRHPVADIARVAADAGAAYLVDGIASIGGEAFTTDAWGVSAVVTSTQKGLEAPPGLGVLALGPSGRERVEARSAPTPSWYLSLANWDWYRAEWPHHPHPVTMPTNLFVALASSLQRIVQEVGLERWIADRAALAERCRSGLVDAGFEPVPAPGAGANLVVAMYADDPAAVAAHLAKADLMVSGPLAPLLGRAFRVGLMGRTATEQAVDRLLGAIATFAR